VAGGDSNMDDVGVAESSNSPSKAGFDSAWIEKGTICDIDLKNWTVDVVSEYSGKKLPNLQIMNPYFHTHSGEGIFAMPEVGSLCLFCSPSDETIPYVMGFIGSFELEGAKTENLEDSAGDPGIEEDELTTPKSGTTSGDPTGTSSNASARGGRPYLNPGDIMIRTRDQNFLVLRRGGVVQIGSTPMCQTAYIPVLNFIRQFAENYEMSTPGGMIYWNVDRVENDPAGQAPCLYRLVLRDKAQNDKADVQLKMGHVDDNIRYELEIAPTGIAVADGTVTGSKAKITIDVSGNQIINLEGRLTQTIAGNRETTVGGSDSLKVTGARTLEAQTESTVVKAAHELRAASSMETIAGAKMIKAAQIALGNNPQPAIIGPALVRWLASHSHPGDGLPPTQAPTLQSILSKTVTLS
jgi:hypothetical protein